MQSVEPVLENAIKTLQKVVDVRGMGKKWAPSTAQSWAFEPDFLLIFMRWATELEQMWSAYLGVRPHIDARSGASSHCAAEVKAVNI